MDDGPVTDQGHDRPGQPGEKGDNRLERRSSQRRSSNARQLGCVFQDMKPPKSILRKSTDMQKPIQRVKFTKAIARHTEVRDQNPSLAHICPGEPHQRSPNAPKFVKGINPAPHIHEHLRYTIMATALRTPSRTTTSRLSTLR